MAFLNQVMNSPTTPPFTGDSTDPNMTLRRPATPPFLRPAMPPPGSTTPVSIGGAPPAAPMTPVTPASATDPTTVSPTTPSALDQIYAQAADKQRALVALQNQQPDVKPGNWQRIASIIGAFGAGMRSPAEGIKAGQEVLNQPQAEAMDRWQHQVGAAKEDLAAQMQNVDLGMKVAQEKSRAAEEASVGKLRDVQTREGEDTLAGGPEKRKLAAEDEDRNKRADTLAKSGMDPQRVAEFRATGQLKDLDPKNEFEMAITAHQVGPDGKPTPEAKQAAAGLQTVNNMRISQIKAAKDPNEKAKFASEYNTSLTQVRSQMDRELAQLENSPGARFDKGTQARIQGLRDAMTAYDKELTDVRGIMRQGVGLPGEGATAAPAAGAGGAPGAFKVDPAWPAAKGVPDGKVLRDAKGNKVAKAIGGQWQAP
jgi:hypothetical protein